MHRPQRNSTEGAESKYGTLQRTNEYLFHKKRTIKIRDVFLGGIKHLKKLVFLLPMSVVGGPRLMAVTLLLLPSILY